MTSLTSFPCSLERTAASALLLLSAQPPSPSPPPPPPPCKDAAVDLIEEGSVGSSSTLSLDSAGSKSCSSSKTGGASPEDFRARQLRIIAVAARFHEFKLQVARRARSKIIRSSDDWKSNMNCKTVSMSSSEFESTKAASGITSSSSEGSSGQNLGAQSFKKKREEAHCEVLSRKRPGSMPMRLRADAILTFLSEGCASEVKIRQVLGDSPDTSKALRMLLKLDEVKRSGTGGRHNPYIYEVTQGSGKKVLQMWNHPFGETPLLWKDPQRQLVDFHSKSTELQ